MQQKRKLILIFCLLLFCCSFIFKDAFAQAGSVQIITTPQTVLRGSPMSVWWDYTGITPTANDLFEVLTAGGVHAQSFYASSCTTTPGASTPSSGQCTTAIDTNNYAPATYTIELYQNANPANVLATTTFTVTNGSLPTSTPLPTRTPTPTPTPTPSSTPITVFNFGIAPTYSISGTVNIDYDNDTAADDPYTGVASLTLSGTDKYTGQPFTVPTTSNASGNYAFVGTFASDDATVSIAPIARFAIPTTTLTAPVPPNATGKNFLIVPLYQISGLVFNDQSKDGVKNGAEPNMSGTYTIQVTGPSGNPTTQTFPTTSGTYTTGSTLSEGIYTVSYISAIPDGYRMTNPPPAITPPSFSVTVGRGCNASAALGALCIPAGFSFTASDIQDLNFGMTNNIPWFQLVCSNGRIDGTIGNDSSTQTGFSDPIPDTAAEACGGPNASIIAPICTTPGIIYSSTTPDFGQGQASDPQDWQVESPYTPNNVDTSYGYMIATIRQSGITPLDLADVCTLNGCTLPADLASGIYHADSDVLLHAFAADANKSYVFLINGDLTIDGEINLPLGTSGIFSVAGNITVDRTVGVGTGASNYCSQQSNIDGLFSADGSFIIDGVNDCSAVEKDQRLNIAGSVVVNAAKTGGSIQNERDLCDDDRFAPAFSIIGRPDFLLSTPEFIKKKADVWQEVAP
ncbi:MAG: hypothetical protein KBD46_00775 [Candidatus Levybacteria bacterium]|nr:hypothetical protein [Candidatus Levybacteria bacterium]